MCFLVHSSGSTEERSGAPLPFSLTKIMRCLQNTQSDPDHFRMDDHKLNRFTRAMNASSSVHLVHHNDLTFVTVNSMAFEGDDCRMCRRAETALKKISRRLNCARVR